MKHPQQDLFFEITRMLVPRDFLEYFSVFEGKEIKSGRGMGKRVEMKKRNIFVVFYS